MARYSARHRRTIQVLILSAAALLFLGLLHSNTALQTVSYDASFASLPDGFDGCRIAVISDLHGATFGRHNAALFSAIEESDADYIFYLGDLEDRYRGAAEGYAESVAAGLSAIAPTYYITGNHEWAIGNVPEQKLCLEENGITTLSNEFLPLERNGSTVLLAGIDDPNGFADQKTPEEVAAALYAEHGDVFWILLAHRNTRFAEEYSLLGADLVLSGHGHGGIVRLPFTDGLLSADRTFFPSYTSGFYEENGSLLFATRGLGNSGPSLRLFNPPEIAVLTLHKG